jgi:glycosyltransferase involved in cell wall biosynthesis
VEKKTEKPNSPMVTVVTVVFNDAEGLEKTMLSVEEQTYENKEFVVIDGGSEAPTLDVIENHQDHIDFWISEPDKGIYDAMNKGVDHAKGEWVIFMNAGDIFYDKDVISTVFCKDHEGADFIYGHTHFLSGDFNGIVKAWDFDILWKTMIFTHQSVFTRREILEGHRFNINYKVCADYDLIFSSYMKGCKFVNSDTVISAISPGMSDVNRARMAVEKWRTVRKFRSDLRVHSFYIGLIIRRFFRDIKTRIARRMQKKQQ